MLFSGAYGVDFSHDTDTVAEGVQKVAKGLLQYGVTSFCPTVVTSPKEDYQKVLYYAEFKPDDIKYGII